MTQNLPLVFIHGSGSCGGTWFFQTEAITGSIAVTLPGHPEGTPCGSIDEYTEWLARYCSEQGLARCILAGHSMGGGIAMTYALKYPSRLAGLICIATGARLRVIPALIDTLKKNLDRDPEWCLDLVKPMYAALPSAVQDRILNLLRHIPPATLLNDFLCCDRFDIMEKVSGIEAPTLIICGEEDVMTPLKYSRFLADRIPESRLVTVPRAGHMVFLECPEQVNREITSFISEVAES